MGGLPLGLKSWFFAETCPQFFFATSQNFEKITNKSETEFCVDCTKKEVSSITVRGENSCESYVFFNFLNKLKNTNTFLKYIFFFNVASNFWFCALERPFNFGSNGYS